MTNRGTLATLALALTASLVLASSASAASAGEEYLPKLPSAGASSAGSEYWPDKPALRPGISNDSRRTTGSHTVRAATSPQQAPEADNPAKKRKASKQRKASKRLAAAALASDQNGGGGGGSGSILLSPLVLLMIGAVIAAAVGMTLSRNRRDDSEWEGERRRQGPRRETTGPRTPEGEILAGPDQPT